jgi:hypothetical protein
MGGSSSKSAVSILNEIVTNVAMETVQDCLVVSDQEQDINMTNTGFKLWSTVDITQTTDVSSSCFSNSLKETELQNNLISAISQATTAEGVGLLSAFGASQAEAETNLQNLVETNIKMSNIQKSYTLIQQKQKVGLNNVGTIVFEDVNISQGAEVFAAATLLEVTNSGITNLIDTNIDQTTSAITSNPLDFIGNIFGSVAASVAIIAFVFIALIAFIIYMIFRGGNSRAGGGYIPEDLFE